ncbi:hypothetical protein LSAT2_011950, partial [Lamellibrachia satsuma]
MENQVWSIRSGVSSMGYQVGYKVRLIRQHPMMQNKTRVTNYTNVIKNIKGGKQCGLNRSILVPVQMFHKLLLPAHTHLDNNKLYFTMVKCTTCRTPRAAQHVPDTPRTEHHVPHTTYRTTRTAHHVPYNTYRTS